MDLPNLNAVRAFEAAARLGGFARAAEEIGVTPAAVSKHVRGLEASLGVTLFVRGARQVTLTLEGARFAATAYEALSELAQARRGLRGARRRERVTVEVDSDILTCWLLPRVTDAVIAALDVQLDLRARPETSRGGDSEADIAIVWGLSGSGGRAGEPFLHYTVFPVCAPALALRENADEDALRALLQRARLVHDRGLYWWRRVFDQLDLTLDAAADHLFFNRSYLCMQAAEAGLGIAIGDDLVAAEALRKGTLIRLPGLTVTIDEALHLRIADGRHPRPAVQRVVRWLRDLASGASG